MSYQERNRQDNDDLKLTIEENLKDFWYEKLTEDIDEMG